MRVFTGFQTQDGVERDGDMNTKKIPVVYGNMSRVVAHHINKGDTYQNQRLPLFAVHLDDIEIDTEQRRNFHHKENINSYKANPTNPKTVNRLMGPAYIMQVSVSVYASSIRELLEIVEQVLLVFNPRITIHVDSSVYNSNYITEINLDSIQNDIQYPMGTDSRIVMMTLGFSVPVRLSYPSYIGDGSIIEQIKWKIIEETSESVMIEDSVGELNEEEDDD